MEIERKFLAKNDGWRKHILNSEKIIQFFLTPENHSPLVRLRIKGNTGYVTIKYAPEPGPILVREEFEYQIPVEDIRAQMGQATGTVIEKTRHTLPGPDGKIWEIDEFKNPRKGLILAEIELTDLDDTISFPDWLGEEVTQDPDYTNLSLSFLKEQTS